MSTRRRARSTVDLAQYDLAQLQIVYSTIRAPATGYIGRKNVEVGNRVSSGQTLMAVVGSQPVGWWRISRKRNSPACAPASRSKSASIRFPTRFSTARSTAFRPQTGNEFALLPADNSTGNFTKIVQRVPVKVVFDPASTKGYEERIRAGESAVVKVALTPPAVGSDMSNSKIAGK